MRSTYKQLYYINRSKIKADGTTAIMCRVTIDGKATVLSTGLYCRPNEWNSKKGEHLRSTDKWKEDAMKQIRENADIRFSTQSTNFNVWGMPFFTESKHHIFDIAIKQSLEI